ncbi:MAG TPA: excisionase family DNA-binding protein [Holophaga sp.]|nr:excisionase family DNA-binding protein [Holophaga sp.]
MRQDIPSNITTLRTTLSVTEFCQVTGMGRTLVFQLMKEGRIRSIRAGRRRFIPQEVIDQWVAGLLDLGPRKAADERCVNS